MYMDWRSEGGGCPRRHFFGERHFRLGRHFGFQIPHSNRNLEFSIIIYQFWRLLIALKNVKYNRINKILNHRMVKKLNWFTYTIASYYVLICSSQFTLNHCHSQYK